MYHAVISTGTHKNAESMLLNTIEKVFMRLKLLCSLECNKQSILWEFSHKSTFCQKQCCKWVDLIIGNLSDPEKGWVLFFAALKLI